jgi:hypothetical protein
MNLSLTPGFSRVWKRITLARTASAVFSNTRKPLKRFGVIIVALSPG